ncbi:MAG: hypothetical protein Kapaf2KO_23970 [Candidatus Kapaibacteriales bacterium]
MEKIDKSSEMIQRLETVAKSLYGSLGALATDLGKSPSYFSSYKSQNKALGMKLLNELKLRYGINPEYISDGQRPVFIKNDDANPLSDEQNVVEKSHIKRYKRFLKEDTKENLWDSICKKFLIHHEVDEIYEVISDGTPLYFSKPQFETIFRII